MRRVLVALIIAVLPCCGMAAPASASVEQGRLHGITEPGLTVYLGIPFAAPPVGGLRWRAPQPAAHWQGVRAADKFAPECMQAGPPSASMSEDCLYLNVWTPAKSGHDRIPVLVWIYGGGFNAGATSIPTYNGAELARKGVVLVSIAYRVGPFGFFAHPELTAESRHHASGNYGLLDMIAGLQWVKKNVAAFGGDPAKVTIFGESAGGIAVSMLCASPLAKGLFQGAISESGGSFGPPRERMFPGENMRLLPQAEQSGEAFARSLGANTIEALRKAPAEKILEAARPHGLAWPIIDGYVIPDDQFKLYEEGKFNDTRILIGYNSDEGATFSHDRTPQEYIQNVRARYGQFADSLIQAYPVGKTGVPKTARDLARDATFGWHTWSWARLESRLGHNKVYFYYFDQHPAYPAGSLHAGYGSPHGEEVPYVFETLHGGPRGQPTAADYAVSEDMSTYWTNFAKYGNPNGPGVPQWPAFSSKNQELMYFSNGKAYTGPVPSQEGLKALDGYFTWRRTAEGARFGSEIQTQAMTGKQR
jgi:para-nitrobenzyl esterase